MDGGFGDPLGVFPSEVDEKGFSGFRDSLLKIT
jgi:hypothetical protein